MKRGFLNTEKAKRKLEDYVPQDDTREDKGKAKAEPFSVHSLPDTMSQPLLYLHSVPPSVKSSRKHRFIFLHWPRDPKGKIMKPSEIRGKEAGNGLDLWGATLYDFYRVQRIPDNIHLSTISTGSKLTRVMKSFGELEHAASQIALAAREPDPVEIPAWDPAEAIVAYERRVYARFSVANKVNTKSVLLEAPVRQSEVDIQQPDTSEPAEHVNVANLDAQEVCKVSEDSVNEMSGQPVESVDGPKAQQTPSTVSVESPFHPSHYPPPWPVVPFESLSPYPLQRGIPIHLLPKKLYVHDPWKLANTNLDPDTIHESEKASWNSKSDHVRTYTLWLPPKSQEMMEDSARQATTAEDKALDVPETVYRTPQQTEGPTEQPAIRAFLPKRPRKRTEVPEAHLYISPKNRIGKGHHSIVYEAELELPRDLFCESTYCEFCVAEQIKVEVDRLKESGEWERLLEEHVIDKHGPRTSESSSSSVPIPPRHVGVVRVNVEHQPMETVSFVSEEEAANGDIPYQLLSHPVINRTFYYEGLVVPVYPNVQWQNPSLPDTICKHREAKPVPQTARFRVAAKLSLPDDAHLEREAQNYLKFPSHFFQHWSGYNVVPPLHDPTPVGALVPQFFGYYKPDAPSEADDDSDFLSPILLLEHCGEPICVRKLSIDDRQECAALLLRFHCAGWLHESFAERNILMQKSHPTCSPLEETKDPYYQHRQYSFRLIDFGRSVERIEMGIHAAAGEEMMANKLFGILEYEGMA